MSALETTPSQSLKVPLKTRLYYSLATLGMAAVSGIYSVLLTIYYQDYLGLEARWITLAMLIYAIWNAIMTRFLGRSPTTPAPN